MKKGWSEKSMSYPFVIGYPVFDFSNQIFQTQNIHAPFHIVNVHDQRKFAIHFFLQHIFKPTLEH